MSERQMHRSVFLSLPWLFLVTLCLGCAFVPAVHAQTCGGQGVAVQVLGSGGPELQDKRASSSYLVWQDGQARVLVDAGGGSALRFGESGANMSQLDVILFTHFHVDQKELFGPCSIRQRSRLLSRTVVGVWALGRLLALSSGNMDMDLFQG